MLITVQLLIIAHIVLWALSKKFGWWGGNTITPVEPSESMEFVKDGVINAGLIFFAIALLSTLILGRWFCGWGCHIVMLQDFCGWIMKKCGIRPKAFRSRFLIYVPLILAVYMFIMPVVYRWGLVPLDSSMSASLGTDDWLVQTVRFGSSAIGFPLPYPNMPDWRVSTHLTTSDFWRTFAKVGVAIPFLFVCGFAVVYFLGAKGFCTYGCPYGGFFAPLDKFAAGRILVTDACEHCGHCTAVCTSNVRVHEEVREYGMVVDPGCMKCMDCVSVCPNDALYFGFAKPAVLKGKAKNQTPKRRYDMTLAEEIGAAAVFALSFMAVRGVYEVVPMLMAAGIAGIVTFMAWKLWRMIRDPNVTLHKHQLKLHGSWKRAGWLYAALTLIAIGLTVHSGVVNVALAAGQREEAKVNIPRHLILMGQAPPLDESMTVAADRALRSYELASSLREGGIGLLATWQPKINMQRAMMLAAKRDFAAAENLLRSTSERYGVNDDVCRTLMWLLHGQGKTAAALDFAQPLLLDHEDFMATLDSFNQMAKELGQLPRAVEINRSRLQKFPNHLHTLRVLSLQLLETGEVPEALGLIERSIQIDPRNASARYFHALALADQGRMDQAIEAMQAALRLDPDSIPINSMLAEMLSATGRGEEAMQYRRRVDELEDAHLEQLKKQQSQQ